MKLSILINDNSVELCNDANSMAYDPVFFRVCLYNDSKLFIAGRQHILSWKQFRLILTFLDTFLSQAVIFLSLWHSKQLPNL